jgi:hypothetical protein
VQNAVGSARCRWLTSVILATQEAEISRIVVQSQPGQFSRPYLKNTHHIKRACGVAQGVGSGFKPQYWGKKKKKAVVQKRRCN